MDFGAAIFFTDYSMGPAELGRALEERGFGSLWAPEHSHIPLSRRSPFPQGGELPKKYYDVMDPFVTLAATAAATTRLRVATGVCLVVQRDPIQTAKQVATLDQISGGRFLFGIGAGWNAEEMADHGTDFKARFRVMRERVEAMKAIWTQEKAEFHGEHVDFDPVPEPSALATLSTGLVGFWLVRRRRSPRDRRDQLKRRSSSRGVIVRTNLEP